MRKIRQNLFWALGYNTVAIPVAAAGRLNPMIASAAMAMSSVSVLSNSLRLQQNSKTNKWTTRTTRPSPSSPTRWPS